MLINVVTLHIYTCTSQVNIMLLITLWTLDSVDPASYMVRVKLATSIKCHPTWEKNDPSIILWLRSQLSDVAPARLIRVGSSDKIAVAASILNGGNKNVAQGTLGYHIQLNYFSYRPNRLPPNHLYKLHQFTADDSASYNRLRCKIHRLLHQLFITLYSKRFKTNYFHLFCKCIVLK